MDKQLTALILIKKEMYVEKYLKAKDLPQDWENNIKDNLYLKRSFLEFIEQINNSEKSYYVFRNSEGQIDTQFLISKTDDNDIAMFTPFNLRVILNSVYYPFTLSKPAGVFGNETQKEVSEFLKHIKGFKLILNLDKSYNLDGFSKGLICPKCYLPVKWATFADYMASLRSGYRRRYNIALNKSKGLKFYILNNNKEEFSEQMYNLYLDVYNKAEYKLGKVSIDFFKRDNLAILILEDKQEVQGFAALDKNNEELIFEFVGLNKKNISRYDIYIRLLIEIIRYGIENGYKNIDFGQTTDDAKLKLGCKYEMLYALINHSNPVINYLLKQVTPYIQYKPLDENKYHVFKTN